MKVIAQNGTPVNSVTPGDVTELRKEIANVEVTPDRIQGISDDVMAVLTASDQDAIRKAAGITDDQIDVQGPKGDKGADGRNPEFSNDGVDLLWRLEGDEAWNELVTLDEITGPQGETGEPGKDGQTGPAGMNGDKGEKGDKGDTGEQGMQGVAGPQGSKGDKGDAGEKGDQGIQGVAGPQGERGEPGPQGEKGDKGDAGIQGATGAQGAQGVKGDKGDKGEAGPQGATGPAGATGLTGAAGPQGKQGEQGIQGLTGATGATGPQGPAGQQGVKGETGAKGDTGATGQMGPAGAKGDQGIAGPAGPIGLTGPQGLQGIQGPQGPAGVNATATSTATSMAAGLMSAADKVILDRINSPVITPVGANVRAIGTSFTLSSTRNARVTYTVAYSLTALLTVGQNVTISATVDGAEVARVTDAILLGLAGTINRSEVMSFDVPAGKPVLFTKSGTAGVTVTIACGQETLL